MKKGNLKLMSLLIAGGLIVGGCGNNNDSKDNNHENHEHQESMEHDHSSHNHGETAERDITSNNGEIRGDLTQVLNHYFSLNEQLVKDDASSAANVSEKLTASLKSFSTNNLSEGEQKEVNEIMESAIENTEHIAKNAGNISHQREHLISLSVDVKDLIVIVGTSKKLYEVFCPMANNNDGAIWISNKEAISNPYMGSKMPKCGKVQRVIN